MSKFMLNQKILCSTTVERVKWRLGYEYIISCQFCLIKTWHFGRDIQEHFMVIVNISSNVQNVECYIMFITHPFMYECT